MKKLLLIFSLLIPLATFAQYEFYYAYHLFEVMDQQNYDLTKSFESQANHIFITDQNDRSQLPRQVKIEYNLLDTSATSTIQYKLNEVLPKVFQFYQHPTDSNTIIYKDIEFLYTTFSSDGNLHSGGGLTGFGINQTDVLLALASVIIDRAKQQLADTYLNNWANKMEEGIAFCYLNGKITALESGGECKSENGQKLTIKMSRIFPNTYLQLKQGEEIIAPEFGKTFVRAMEKDMKELMDNVYNELPIEIKNDYPQVRYSYAAYNLYNEMTNGAGFPNAYESFVSTAAPNTSASRTLADELLQFSGNIVKSFLSPKTDNFFELPDRSAIYNDKLWNMYLAMMSKKMKDEDYTELYAKLEGINNDSKKAQPYLKKLYDNGMTIEEKIKTYSKLSKNEEISIETKISHITGISKSGLDMLDVLLKMVNQYSSDASEPFISKDVQSAIAQSKIGLEFTEAIGTKNYASAANSVFQLLNEFYKGKINPELFKYITLVADVTTAESAEEVKEIFDRAILPAGSYHIKRSTKFSASINAYVGPSAGYEWNARQGDGQKLMKGGATIGATIPIGVALNWSKGDEDNEGWSHSLFVSVLDLGGLLNYNLKSDDSTFLVANNPSINFENVLSPGGAYIVGVKNHPLALSFGVQYMPKLRNVIDAENVVIDQASAFQLRFGLLVDVPLFHVALRGDRHDLTKKKR
ncbi:MAG: hypothetical protein R2730_03970 [Chitinophagales bacterium]